MRPAPGPLVQASPHRSPGCCRSPPPHLLSLFLPRCWLPGEALPAVSRAGRMERPVAGPSCILHLAAGVQLLAAGPEVVSRLSARFPAWQHDGPARPLALAAAGSDALPSSLTTISHGQPAAGNQALRAAWSQVPGPRGTRVRLAAGQLRMAGGTQSQDGHPLVSLRNSQHTCRSVAGRGVMDGGGREGGGRREEGGEGRKKKKTHVFNLLLDSHFSNAAKSF